MKDPYEKIQYNIAQVTSTMAIEDMPPDSQTLENLMQLADGKKMADEIIRDIKKEYANG